MTLTSLQRMSLFALCTLMLGGVWVVAFEFIMGGRESTREKNPPEQPQHILDPELEQAQRRQAKADQGPWGTLEGRVVWAGALPTVESLEDTIKKHPERERLLKGLTRAQMADPKWQIDPTTNGVANVCIFIKRPAHGYLPIHRDDKVRKEPVVVDSPHCYYKPHIALHYPEWSDGKERGKTGERFIIRDSSDLGVSTALSQQFGVGIKLTPKDADREHVLKPNTRPIAYASEMYGFMNGYAWAFDHPYFALTKSDGTYTIPRVPADLEVRIVAWHEAQDWLFAKAAKTMTLREGKNAFDIEMTAR